MTNNNQSAKCIIVTTYNNNTRTLSFKPFAERLPYFSRPQCPSSRFGPVSLALVLCRLLVYHMVTIPLSHIYDTIQRQDEEFYKDWIIPRVETM